MEIDNSILNNEIESVLHSSFNPTTYTYRADIKIGTDVYPVNKIVEIDEHNDYEYSFGSVRTVKLAVGLGDYSSIIYPNRDKLEIMITTEKVYNTNFQSLDEEDTIEVITYNAQLDPNSPPVMTRDVDTEFYPREQMNLMGIREIVFQIKPKLLDDVAKITIGGQFLNITNLNLAKNIINFYCNDLELPDEEKLLGINVQGKASEVKKKTVIIPHGLKLTDLADYLQHKQGGIFSTGLAQFIFKRWWYIFAAYDTVDYEDSENKVVLISVPQKRYPSITKSWLKKNNVITILATGNRNLKSDKQAQYDNVGNGIMFTDANTVIKGFHQEQANIATINRGGNNSEFAGEDIGKNHMTLANDPITANPFAATSRIAKAKGHYLIYEWQNCDPNIIKPGMKFKIQMLVSDQVVEVNGILLKSHVQTILNGEGMLANGHRSHAALVIFVKADEINAYDILSLN